MLDKNNKQIEEIPTSFENRGYILCGKLFFKCFEAYLRCVLYVEKCNKT